MNFILLRVLPEHFQIAIESIGENDIEKQNQRESLIPEVRILPVENGDRGKKNYGNTANHHSCDYHRSRYSGHFEAYLRASYALSPGVREQGKCSWGQPKYNRKVFIPDTLKVKYLESILYGETKNRSPDLSPMFRILYDFLGRGEGVYLNR